jgi:hypothetical protein
MRHLFLAVACALVLTACGAESLPDSFDSDAGMASAPMAFVDGHFAQSENIYEMGEYEKEYSDSYGASLSFSTPTNDRAVMTILLLTYGGLTHPDLAIGQTHTLGRGDLTPNGLLIRLIGCEGSEVGVWNYDRSADEVVLTVTSPEPGVRRINYTATWPSYFVNSTEPDVISGYFDLVK